MLLLLCMLANLRDPGVASLPIPRTSCRSRLTDSAGMLAATPLLITLFYGVEAATEVGEEVRDGASVIRSELDFQLSYQLLPISSWRPRPSACSASG